MLVAVLPVKDFCNLKQKIKHASQLADCIELRLDYLSELEFNTIEKIRDEIKLPIILTLRKKSQGGFYPYSEEKRQDDILTLCQLNPDYIDLEYDVSNDFIEAIKVRFPNIDLICSYHNFTETPDNLSDLFQALQHPFFDRYKIATFANKTSDALRMLQFIKKHHSETKLIGICIGEKGQSTRILSPIVGNVMTYAALDSEEKTAEGQLTCDDLLKIYHYKKLNPISAVYALLGDPVSHSVGHILHNEAIGILEKNAVYIKLRVTQEELPEIMDRCRNLPICGFSITMPLKETGISFLDEIKDSSKSIQAINSIVKQEKKYIGFNTDGMGAIQALSERVNIENQKVLILGAGGAARAIAYEALRHKAKVIIFNRTIEKAKKLANELGCESTNLVSNLDYTIIINTVPNPVYSDQIILNLLPHTIAMDIIYHPINTNFLQMAQQSGCICIYGYEMYINQALLQIKRWFNPSEKQLNQIKKRMNQYFLKISKIKESAISLES